MKSSIKKEDGVLGEENTNEPIPLRPENNEKKKRIKNIKYPVIVFSIALIIGGLTFINAGNSPSVSENQIAAEKSISIENINSKKIASLETAFDSFQSDFGRVTDKLTGLSNQLSHFVKREEVILRGEAEGLFENIKLIQSDINRIDQAYAKVNQKLTKKDIAGRKKNRPVVFNFDIDGLGSWGGKPFLSVGYRGKYKMMEIGEKINGWVLMNLDLVSRVAVFKHQSGRSVTRHV